MTHNQIQLRMAQAFLQLMQGANDGKWSLNDVNDTMANAGQVVMNGRTDIPLHTSQVETQDNIPVQRAD